MDKYDLGDRRRVYLPRPELRAACWAGLVRTPASLDTLALPTGFTWGLTSLLVETWLQQVLSPKPLCLEFLSFTLTEPFRARSPGKYPADGPEPGRRPGTGLGLAGQGAVTLGFPHPLRCPGPTLHDCNATMNAVCAPEPSPEPGKKQDPIS